MCSAHAFAEDAEEGREDAQRGDHGDQEHEDIEAQADVTALNHQSQRSRSYGGSGGHGSLQSIGGKARREDDELGRGRVESGLQNGERQMPRKANDLKVEMKLKAMSIQLDLYDQKLAKLAREYHSAASHERSARGAAEWHSQAPSSKCEALQVERELLIRQSQQLKRDYAILVHESPKTLNYHSRFMISEAEVEVEGLAAALKTSEACRRKKLSDDEESKKTVHGKMDAAFQARSREASKWLLAQFDYSQPYGAMFTQSCQEPAQQNRGAGVGSKNARANEAVVDGNETSPTSYSRSHVDPTQGFFSAGSKPHTDDGVSLSLQALRKAARVDK